MDKIIINRDYREKGRAPLYCKYDGQINPQPAYIELTENGQVNVNYSGEIGNAIPATVWHNRDYRFSINSQASIELIDSILEHLEPLLQELHNNHSVEWDGQNMVGKLTDKGTQVYYGIKNYLNNVANDDYIIEVWNISDWFDGATPQTFKQNAKDWSDISIEDIESTVKSDEATENIIIEGSAEYLYSILKE